MSRSALLALTVLALPAAAQPKGGEVQPDKIAFGTVYTGAIVEASLMAFDPGTDPKVRFEVTAPKFVTIRNKAARHQQFGPGNDFVCGTVQIAIDTVQAGDLSGEVVVTLGDSKVKVPVTATVKAAKKGYSRVLLAETPFHATATKDGNLFREWTDLVAASPLDVSYLLTVRDKPVFRDLNLSKFDCIFLDGDGLWALTDDDVKKVRKYAEGGGRVVVAANYFFRGSVKKANAVLADSGVEMKDEEARGAAPGQNGATIAADGLHPRLVKDGIKSVEFFRASPSTVTDTKIAGVLVKAEGVGRAGDAFVAAGTLGKGEVIAIGQSLWWHWIAKEQAKGADNAKLLRWLLVPKGGA